jgi:hypothetical protein
MQLALKGRDITAQGVALGNQNVADLTADPRAPLQLALKGRNITAQGVALG